MGRGTAATYSYRHLLQVLAIKLRQMEGATLAAIEEELVETAGDALERRVAAALGPNLPAPGQLPLTGQDTPPRGRAGQALRALARPREDPGDSRDASTWHRMWVGEGIELHLREDHPLIQGHMEAQTADAVRLAIGRIVSQLRSLPVSPKPRESQRA
jgi:hypothetical protein